MPPQTYNTTLANPAAKRPLWDGSWLPGLVLTILAVGFSIPFVTCAGSHADEFTNIYNGVRMAHGAWIYRDFFEFTAPLSHALAGLIAVTIGPSLLAARVLVGLAVLSAVALTWRLTMKLGVGPWFSLFPALAVVVCIYRTFPGFNHHPFGLPFLAGALLLAVSARPAAPMKPLAGAGFLAGMAVLSIQGEGFALTGGLFVGLLGLGILGAWSWRSVGLAIAAFGLGWLVPILTTGAVFAAVGGLGDLVFHTWTWPMTHYRSQGNANDIPFATDLPKLLVPVTSLPGWYLRVYHMGVLVLLPFVAAAGAALWGLERVGLRLTGTKTGPEQAPAVLLGVVALACFAIAVRGRADYWHMSLFSIPAYVLAAAFSTAIARRYTEHPLLRGVGHAALALFVLTGAGMEISAIRKDPSAWFPKEGPEARMAAEPLFRWIRTHTQADDRIVAVPSGGIQYFFGRPPAVNQTLMMNKSLKYYTLAEFEAFWADALAQKPALIVIGPWNLEEGAKNLWDLIPESGLPGYRRVSEQPTMFGRPAVIFARER